MSSTTQTFTLTVGEAPTISSADTATATVGTSFSFMVTDAGNPVPSFSESGALPTGLTFVDNGDGTANFTGTPAAGTGGVYPITITATNGAGSVTQAFTLIVDQAASITSASTATFAAKSTGSFSITATGYPVPTLTEAGPCPPGSASPPAPTGWPPWPVLPPPARRAPTR